MKVVSATILSCLMFTASGAFADVNTAPLAPGKPAGVHDAQFLDGDNGIFIVAGAALVGITAALASAGNGVSANSTGAAGGGSSSSSSTTGTTP
jgi:hypothetical protein